MLELEAERVELDADLVDERYGRWWERGPLVLEPQFGAGDHVADVTGVEIAAARDLHFRIVREHPDCRDHSEEHREDPVEADAADDQPGDHRRKHNRDQRTADQLDPGHQVLAPELGRATPDRLRADAAMAAAVLVIADERPALGYSPIGLGGQVARHWMLSDDSSPPRRGGVGGGGARRSRASMRAPSTPNPTLPLEGEREERSVLGRADKAINPPLAAKARQRRGTPAPVLPRGRCSPWTSRPRPTARRRSASCWRAP